MTTWSVLGLQEGASPLIGELVFFHDHTMIVIIIIVTFVGFIIGSLVFNGFIDRFLLENQNIEIVWTILPVVILVFIALPSLRLLYLLDEVNNPGVTLKVIGHQ